MTSVVCFHSGGTEWAVEVEHVRRVHGDADVVPLPHARPGVEGVLRPDADGEALTVLTLLGTGGQHLLELEAAGRRCALRVDRVTGVRRDVVLAAAPEGQEEALACAVVLGQGERAGALLLDPEALLRLLARAPLPPGEAS